MLSYQEGIEHHLITTTKSSHYQAMNGRLNVHYFPTTMQWASCPFSRRLLSEFKQLIQKADILHYHFPWPFADMLHCMYADSKPAIVTYHSDIIKQKWLNKAYTPLMQAFLKRVNLIIATSENYVATSPVLQKHLEKCQVIPVGLRKADYSIDPQKLITWRKKLPSSYALFVGVLRYYKGLSYLLEAMVGVNFPLVIAGDGPEASAFKKAS